MKKNKELYAEIEELAKVYGIKDEDFLRAVEDLILNYDNTLRNLADEKDQKKKYSLGELLKDCKPENRHEEIGFEKSDEDGFTMTIQDRNGLFDKLDRKTLRKKLLDKTIQDNYEALKKLED